MASHHTGGFLYDTRGWVTRALQRVTGGLQRGLKFLNQTASIDNIGWVSLEKKYDCRGKRLKKPYGYIFVYMYT